MKNQTQNYDEVFRINHFYQFIKKYCWLIGIVATLILFFVIIEIKHPYYFLQDDNRDLGLPNFVHTFRSLISGEIALFNFHQNLGTPFMAMGQWLVFYPFSYLSVFLSQLFLGCPDGTMDIFSIMHFIGGSIGFFMFLKIIGIKNLGAFFGAIMWPLNSFVFYISNSWAVIALFAGLFPWMMYLSIKLYKKFDWKSFIALILIQSCYTGYVQLFLYGMLFEALTIIFLVLFDIAKKKKLLMVIGKCKFVILAYILAFIVSLPQFLPMFNQMNLSESRGGAMQWGAYIYFKNNINEWFYCLLNSYPNKVNSFTGNVSFIGTITLVFVVIAIVNMIIRRKIRSYTYAFMILAVFALLWSAGDSLIGQFFYQIPIFNRFRWMFKLVIFVNFYLIALAAIGFQYAIDFIEWIFRNFTKKVIISNVVAWLIIIVQLGQFTYIYSQDPVKNLRRHDDTLPLNEPLKKELSDGRILSVGNDNQTMSKMIAFNYATLNGLYHFAGYEPLLSAANGNAILHLNYHCLYANFIDGLPAQYEYFKKWGVKYYVVDINFLEQIDSSKFKLEYIDDYRKIYIDKTASPLFFRESDKTSNGIESKINVNSIELKLDNKQEDEIYILFLYNEFFKAKIDGKDVQINRDDIGRMVIKVPAGQHSVVIKYTEPYMMAGFAIMILIISGIFILWMIYKRLNMRVFVNGEKEIQQ